MFCACKKQSVLKLHVKFKLKDYEQIILDLVVVYRVVRTRVRERRLNKKKEKESGNAIGSYKTDG